MKAYRTVLLGVVLVASACGDPSSTDHRGYTKAPLEHPTVLIRAEKPGDVAQYGHPNRVVADEIELAVETAPAAPASAAAPVTFPAGVTQAMADAGKTQFSTGTCMACHGATGGGSPLAPPLNDGTWLNIDGSYDAIVQVITAGVPKPKQFAAMMPPKGGGAFTDAQVRELAAYVFSISRTPGAAPAAH